MTWRQVADEFGLATSTAKNAVADHAAAAPAVGEVVAVSRPGELDVEASSST